MCVEVTAIFEENDISASKYSKKDRPDFQSLIELIKKNKIDVIFATEVERLGRQPAEAEHLIDLAGNTDLREVNLDTRKRRTSQLADRQSLLQAWEANESIGWRLALIDMVVDRIDVFPGIGKPFVNVDGVTMRFDKDRVAITWRRGESNGASAA